MLSQVGQFFGTISRAQALQETRIPFTKVTLGDAIDYARVFKNEVLDPLFKSGDALKPDANSDGRVDLADLNFNGIQSMLDRITTAIGLPAGTLKATFNPTTNELKFNFTLDPWFGLGTSAEALTRGKAVVTTARQGNAAPAQNEVQELAVNATSGFFKVSFNGQSTGFHSASVSAAALQSALRGLSSIGPSGNTNVNVTLTNGVYRIEFVNAPSSGGLGNTDVSQLTVDLGVPGLGTLGLFNDGTRQTILVPPNAGTFWLAYPDAGGRMELTDQLTSAATAAEIDAALERLSGIGPNHLTVTKNTDLGPTTYVLTLSLPSGQKPRTKPILANADAAVVGMALEALGDIGMNNVSVMKSSVGPSAVYTITFINGKGNRDVSTAGWPDAPGEPDSSAGHRQRDRRRQVFLRPDGGRRGNRRGSFHGLPLRHPRRRPRL